ncbi:hypothetical protein [Streptomyces agglomeratus]|nr:hypothetical protein [Streptomyces agglomeratus]
MTETTHMPRILPNAYAVGWNMIKIMRVGMPARRSLTSGGNSAAFAVRMGEWVFTPASGHSAREAGATLRDDDRWIDLRYSAPLLEDLLAELRSIEADFVARSSSAEVSDWPGVQSAGQPHA